VAVGGGLAAYGVGVLRQATVKLFSSGFYALRDTKTPVKIASFSLLLSSALAYLLMRRYGPAGIALGSSLGAWVNVVLHVRDLNRRVGRVLAFAEWRAFAAALLGRAVADSAYHAALVRQISDLETIIVPNEAQALLLENNLIKEHKPRFNVRLTDDKSYPQIAVTLGEPFPRVLVVRRVSIEGARYFGPYTDVGTLRQTLKIIRRIFTVRSCHWDLPRDAPDRPCLDYHIERCRAPCVGYQSQDDYRRMIEDVVLFLEGKTLDVRARLRERMLAA